MNQQELGMEIPAKAGVKENKYDSNVLPFSFKGASIRTTSQGGNPWFVLPDVCRALGIVNPTQVADRLDDDEKNTLCLAEGIRGNPNVTIINEPGLYSVILRSDKPEAKEFKRWICHEVLPAIRKTGSYSTAKPSIHMMKLANETEGLVKLATLFGLKGNQALLSASSAAQRLLGVNPLEIMDIQLEAPSQQRHMTPTQIGEELEKLTGRKHSARMINNTLLELGYQIKTAAGWQASETAISEGLAVLKDTGKKRSAGTPIQQLFWSREMIEILKGGVK